MKHQAKKQTRNQHMPVVIVCILILVLAVMGLALDKTADCGIISDETNEKATVEV